ncbi:MAG: c-type cytochrome [Thermoguttaceae bacterium]|nr:c-type cytochrome [Thermoguttaceae bacterium]
MCSEAELPPPKRPTSRRRRVLAATFVVLAAAAVVALGPRAAAWLARRIAVDRIDRCRFAAAERWLEWSARLGSGDAQTLLLQAACRRQLGFSEAWRRTLELARDHGAAEAGLERERRLAAIQGGTFGGDAGDVMSQLSDAGATLRDIMTSFLQGCLVQRNAGMARAFIERMSDFFADEAHTAYLRGVFWRRQGDLAQAETHLANALAAEPDHELARAELAEVCEEQWQLGRALREYVELEVRSGGSDVARLGMARVLRKMGRLDEGKNLLAPLIERWPGEPSVQIESARIALAEGRYGEAADEFQQVAPVQDGPSPVLTALATALALAGRQAEAQPLLARAADLHERSGWILDLRFRLANHPNDSALAEELQRVWQSPAANTTAKGGLRHRPAELYALHCQSCHGANGDGQGLAARNLFPRPRDFGTGKMLLVSTRNGVPTLEDIQKVLANGMPGTAMMAFGTLPESDRTLLAQEVLRLQRNGVRERLAKSLRALDEEISDADIRQAIDLCTTAGEPVFVPAVWPQGTAARARGREAYLALGCAKCHGDDGTGAPDEPLFDEQGEPARARDLVHEPFKGGREPESSYRRIAAGMPGTSHPAALDAPQAQLAELVDYVRSLAREPSVTLTNHQRRDWATARTYAAGLLSLQSKTP